MATGTTAVTPKFSDKDCSIKFRSKHSTVLLLCLLRNLMDQTVLNRFYPPSHRSHLKFSRGYVPVVHQSKQAKNCGLSWYYLQLRKSSMICGFPAIFVLCWFSAIDFFLVALRKAAKLEIRGTKHISQGKFQLLPLEKQWNFSAQYWKLEQLWLYSLSTYFL